MNEGEEGKTKGWKESELKNEVRKDRMNKEGVYVCTALLTGCHEVL